MQPGNLDVASRVNAIKELVGTQMSFANDMHLLHRALRNAQHTALSEEDKENVISSLPTLSRVAGEITKSWLNELDRVGQDNLKEAQVAITFLPYKQRISEALQTYALKYETTENFTPRISAYLESALKELQKLKPNVKLLESELIKPVQWLFRYQQLFENILKYTPATHADHPVSVEIIDHFTALTRTVNEKKRWNELRAQAFEPPKNRAAQLKETLQLMKFTKHKSTDPDLEKERVAQVNLHKFCEKLYTWIKEYFSKKRTYLRADREFLESILNACNQSGLLQFLPATGHQTTSELRVNLLEQLQPYVDIVQNTLAYLTNEITPNLEKNVLDRLTDLIHHLEDPKRLIKVFFKTTHDLENVKTQIEQATERNQPTGGLIEKMNTLNSTISTLHSGLLDQMPKLRAAAERILIHALMYVCLLDQNLSTFYSGSVINQLQLDTTAQRVPAGTHESFLQIIEEMVKRVNNKPTNHLREIIPKWVLKSPKQRLGFDLLGDQASGRKLSQLNSIKPNVSGSSINLDGQLGRSQTLKHSRSYSHQNELLGFLPPNSSPTRSPVLLHERTVQLQPGQSHNHYDPAAPISRRIRARKLNTQSMFSNGSDTECLHHKDATHRATHSFYKQSDEQATMLAGQYVNMVCPFDSAGNNQWCLVEVLPGREKGYVPANRLSALNQ